MTAARPTTRCHTIDSPAGPLTLLADGNAITGLRFAKHRHEAWEPDPAWEEADNDALLKRAGGQLREYFAGRRTAFDLTLRPSGTAFQLSVWEKLREIPFGQTISYGELARRFGNANASRAVGLANGRNPIAIFIPCHRVIGANGALVGFGGGLDVKRTLLNHERSL